jgi:hypothetical protein
MMLIASNPKINKLALFCFLSVNKMPQIKPHVEREKANMLDIGSTILSGP